MRDGVDFEDCNVVLLGASGDHCVQVIYGDALIATARVYEVENHVCILRQLQVFGQARPLGTRVGCQGLGVGTKLLAYVEGEMCQRGFRKILLNAAVGARRFFEDRGFRWTSEGFLEKTLTVREQKTITLGTWSARIEEGVEGYH